MKLFRKIMVLAIIGLFLGASVIPSIAGTDITENSISIEDEVGNKIGFTPFRDSNIGYMNGIPSVEDSRSYKMDKTNYKEKKYVSNINVQSGTNKKWTWMFYDDADFTNAFDPLELFAEEAYSGENLDVIVLQDKEHGPAKMWYIDENHNTELLEDIGEVNMGDYQTLYDFVEYSKENYPADRYFISFYDHGGGWMGACVDSTDNGWLTMDEIQKGLTEARWCGHYMFYCSLSYGCFRISV